MPFDDKSPLCLPFILRQLQAHNSPNSPLFIGLNGLQGIGKTTLVSALSRSLTTASIPHVVFSIDDFYHDRATQAALSAEFPTNPLLQHRGEPGTHSLPLLRDVFGDLAEGRETLIPRYDKAAFNGLGDRLPQDQWTCVNAPGTETVRVVLFEGWCVGFKALSRDIVEKRHRDKSTRTLHKHRLQDLLQINSFLEDYSVITDYLGAFIHIDAWDTAYVYDWRLQQERELREKCGSGMTDVEVIKFVDGYYPAYELYLSDLAQGLLPPSKIERNLRIVVSKDRSILDVVTL